MDNMSEKAPPVEETGAEALVEEQDGVDNISEKASPVEKTGAEASVEEREASDEQQEAKPKGKGDVKEKEQLAAKTSIQQVFFKSCWLSSVRRQT